METVNGERVQLFPQHGIECAVAARTMTGESVIGDRSVVVPFEGGVLVAAIDGLGHGEDAAVAAELAAATLERNAGDNAIELVTRCHRALAGTRGVVMSIASLNPQHGVGTWIGVGNVEGIAVQSSADGLVSRSRLITRGGVVGSALPQLRAEVFAITPGDLLVFATDGVDQRFGDDLGRDLRRVDEIADALLAQFGKKIDDSLVLVARICSRE